MEQNNLGLMIGGFIIILIGVVLIGSIANSISELDDTIVIPNNESLTWAGNNTAITLANDDLVSGSETVWNESTKLVSGDHYTITRSYIIFINESSPTGYDFSTASLNITYTHEGDNYLEDGTSRSLINLVILFFALAILSVGYLMVKKGFDNLNM